MSRPQCHYVMPKGVLCSSPAMRGHLHCYYHHQAELRARRRVRLGGPNSSGLDFGTLEDATTIQVAIADVMHHLVDRIIDRSTAATLLYGLQLAMVNCRRMSIKPYTNDVCVGDLELPGDDFDRLDNPEVTKDQHAKQDSRRSEFPVTRVMSVTPEKPPQLPAPRTTSAPYPKISAISRFPKM